MHGTTVICVRHRGRAAMGGDGQVTLGDIVIKSTAKKIREMGDGAVLAGFAGATADAFTLLERFEQRWETQNRQLLRAAEDLARDWRTDRVLRRLEAMLTLADRQHTLILTGNGDVLMPENPVAAIGSGAAYAQAAALAMINHGSAEMTAADIVRESLKIAADTCIYTNHHIALKEIDADL